MARLLVILLALATVVGLAALARSRARRRRDEVPELNKHPERLDQMLDKTDDA